MTGILGFIMFFTRILPIFGFKGMENSSSTYIDEAFLGLFKFSDFPIIGFSDFKFGYVYSK